MLVQPQQCVQPHQFLGCGRSWTFFYTDISAGSIKMRVHPHQCPQPQQRDQQCLGWGDDVADPGPFFTQIYLQDL